MYQYFDINEGGEKIRCKIYYQELSSVCRVILFGHGFSGHKDNGAAEKMAKQLLADHGDTALIVFNLPSHGDDLKEKLSLTDCDRYWSLLLSFVKQKFQVKELYACATSFGGYLVLKYISEHGNPFQKIAFRCPAVNMYDVLTNTIMSEKDYEDIKNGKDITAGFDRKILLNLSFLEELGDNDIQLRDFSEMAEKMLILHGTADEVVPFSAAKAFAEKNHIPFIAVEDADHRFLDPDKMEFAIQQILDFYGKPSKY